jgi:hypothetical protein
MAICSMSKMGRSLHLTIEVWTVNRLSSRSIPVHKVPSMEYESGDNAMKDGTLVTKSMHSRRELSEVSRRLGNHIVVELEHDTSGVDSVNFDIELGIISHNDISVRSPGRRKGDEAKRTHEHILH